MKEGRTLPVIQPASDAGLSRRAALQTLAAGLGASIAVPGLAEANDHPVHKHMAHVAEQAKKPAAAAKPAAAYKPTTFDAHQFATVVVLSELIVPGAKASGTPEFLDKLLTVESADTRRRFITALGAFDGAALKAKQKPFKDLAQADQVALLTEASTGQPSRQPTYWKKGDPIPVPEPPPGPMTLRDHFDHIKGWVVGHLLRVRAGPEGTRLHGQRVPREVPGLRARRQARLIGVAVGRPRSRSRGGVARAAGHVRAAAPQTRPSARARPARQVALASARKLRACAGHPGRGRRRWSWLDTSNRLSCGPSAVRPLATTLTRVGGSPNFHSCAASVRATGARSAR